MSAICIDLRGLNNHAVGKAKKCISNTTSAISIINSTRNGLHQSIKVRRSIDYRLTNLVNKITDIEEEINELDLFITDSVNSYEQAEIYIKKLTEIYEIDSKNSNIVEGFIKDIALKIDELLHKIANIPGAIRTNLSNTYANFKKNIQPGGKWYKVWETGSAIIQIVSGIGIVVGSGIGAVFSGGTLTPVALVVAAVGANEVINGICDLYNLYSENYDKVNQTNFLKDGLVSIGGCLGELVGYKEFGECIGMSAYVLMNVTAFYQMSKEIIKKLPEAISAIKNITKIKPGKLVNELKNLPKNLANITKYAIKDFKHLNVPRQLRNILSVDSLSSLKGVKLANLKNTKAFCDFTKLIGRVKKTLITKRVNKLFKISPNLKKAVVAGVSTQKISQLYGDFKDMVIDDTLDFITSNVEKSKSRNEEYCLA